MKKSFKIALLIVATLVFASLAVACGSADAISVSESDSFQTVYVLGQPLNLSGGVLNVENGKKTEQVALDSEDVTVSGYDKNTLGKQTVTIEYDGATTEITVNVVERLTVINAVTDYLVGDAIDRSKGSVKITDYDGSSRTVQFSGDSVSVSGFDSSVAKAGLDIKVVYTKDGESYAGSYEVNIHAVDSVEFRRPNKITYGSHYEGDVDVAGGRFILKGGENIRREIAVSADMVSGFDVSAATPENSPITQTLTVTYNGVPYTYDVQIAYTDVSMFLDNAEAFNSVAWNGESEPEISEELGKLALKLMTAYIDMPQSERALIDEATAYNVARAAMVYGFEVWGDNIRLFKGVFAIEYGEKVLYLESYDKVKSSLDLFDDEDSAIYTVAPLLLELIDMYGDKVIYENETTRIRFNSYPVMDNYELTVMEAMLEHTVALHDLIKTVPEDWTVGSLENYAETIRQTIVKMMSESYVSEYPGIYYLVSNWRADNDLFDILYNYLYISDKKSAMASLTAYGLPSEIYELYSYILNAVIIMDDVQKVRYTDTAELFYNYYVALECAEKIKAKTGTMENYLYLNVPINALLGMTSSDDVDFETMLDYIRTASCGYYDLSAGLLGIDEYDEFMKEFVALMKNILEVEGFETTDEYAEGVKSIFNKFVALSPTRQYNLIATFNSLYTLGIPELAFDDSEENAAYTGVFVMVINNLMRSKLSGEHTETYNNLILAIEIYANRFGYAEWESDFTSRMDKVISAVGSMSGTDKENFTYYLGYAYDKYTAIRANVGKTTELGDWSDEFADLNKALADMQTAYYYFSTSGYRNYNYFLASFERATDIAEKILAGAPENIKNAYYYEPLFEAYSESPDTAEGAQFWSCEHTLNVYRNLYIDTLVFFGNNKVNVYDTYFDKKMDAFLSSYYDIVSAFVNKEEGQTTVFNKEKTLAFLADFSKLDSNTKAFFITMEGDVDMYYSALQLFISEAFTEKAAEVALKLFNLEKSHYSYEVVPSEVTLNSVRELLAELKTLRAALTGADAESFAVLDEICDYYVAKCQQLVA